MKLDKLFLSTRERIVHEFYPHPQEMVANDTITAITRWLLSIQYFHLTPWYQKDPPLTELMTKALMKLWRISLSSKEVQLEEIEKLAQNENITQQIVKELTDWRNKELDNYSTNVIPRDEIPPIVREWQSKICRDPELIEALIYAEFIQQLRFFDQIENKKRIGSYYTPLGVILYILERLTDHLLNARCPNNIFMDYASGMGNFVFITAALLSLITHESPNPRQSEKLCKWQFYGLDLDTDAIQFALILKNLLESHPKFGSIIDQIQFLASDTLEPLSEMFFRTSGTENATPFQENCIDLILSNPPYVSWGLGRVDKLQKARETTYRNRFSNTAEYKISYYALFIERAVQLLRPGGMAGLIIPDSFLTGKYFAKLRNFLLEETWIKEIILFPKSFWKHANSGDPVILILQKKLETKSLHSKSHENPQILVKSASLLHNRVQLDQKNLMTSEYFRTQPKQRFRLFFTPETMLFVQSMEMDAAPLGKYFEIHHGIRSKTGVGKARIISSQCKGVQWKPGLIAGNSVVPFHIEYRGHFLLTNPEYLFSGGFEPSLIEQEKIILRRTGDHLITAVDELCLYHSNTLMYLIPKAQSFHSLTLYALCAILNSQVMNQYYQYISLKAKRSMAQVEIDTLEQLPLKGDVNLFKELDKISRELHRIRKEWSIHPPMLQQQKSWGELEQLANLLIKNTYFKQL